MKNAVCLVPQRFWFLAECKRILKMRFQNATSSWDGGRLLPYGYVEHKIIA